MSLNIFQHEFRIRFKSVLIWTLSITAVLFFYYSLFPVFADEAAMMDQFLAKYPPALREAFGLGNMDLSKVLGFYSFCFMFVQICLAIQASNIGFGLVSIEESELTADFLLTKPVSRVQVLTSKLLAALAGLIITNLVIWAVSFAVIALFGEGQTYDTKILVLVLSTLILFQLFFLCVGLVISLLIKRIRSVTPYGLGLGLGMYVLSAFTGIFEEIWLELITPFKHMDSAYIIHNGELNTPLVLLNVAVTLVSLGASYWLYLRRDIHAVS